MCRHILFIISVCTIGIDSAYLGLRGVWRTTLDLPLLKGLKEIWIKSIWCVLTISKPSSHLKGGIGLCPSLLKRRRVESFKAIWILLSIKSINFAENEEAWINTWRGAIWLAMVARTLSGKPWKKFSFLKTGTLRLSAISFRRPWGKLCHNLHLLICISTIHPILSEVNNKWCDANLAPLVSEIILFAKKIHSQFMILKHTSHQVLCMWLNMQCS